MQHFDSQPAAPAVWPRMRDAFTYPDAMADLDDMTAEYVLDTDGAEHSAAEATENHDLYELSSELLAAGDPDDIVQCLWCGAAHTRAEAARCPTV